MKESAIHAKCQQAFHEGLLDRIGIPKNAWVGLMVANPESVTIDGVGKSFDEAEREAAVAGSTFPDCLSEYECARARCRIDGSNLADTVVFDIDDDDAKEETIHAIGFFSSEDGGGAEFIMAMGDYKPVSAGDRIVIELAIK